MLSRGTFLWSMGAGATRLSCAVAKTEKGYAVNLYRGDIPMTTELHATREAAVRRALALEEGYAPGLRRPARRY